MTEPADDLTPFQHVAAALRETLAELRTAQADRDDARSWARHGYEIGQRHCGWTDHGVAPAWLTDGWPAHIDDCEHSAGRAAAEARIAAARAECRHIVDDMDDSQIEYDHRVHDALRRVLTVLDDPADIPATIRITPGVARIRAGAEEYLAYPIGSDGHASWVDAFTLARQIIAEPDRISWVTLTGDIDVRGQIAALLVNGKSPEAHGHTEPETAEQLHARRAHPGWEYATTEGQRKAWDHADMTPEGGGWERNTAAGRDGWDRLDYTEESYWRRIIADKRCAICGTHEHGGRDWYQSAQGWLACWPCADGDRPTCPTGERCEGADCYRRDEHGPRPSEGAAS
ncbi:hypothetical protein [Kitasatospora indigofera]|uniref:hypothetical protein n=1 Tax=Kitasatospora indigofera TaxID=67307 RepID=UPI0036B937FB